MPQPCILLVSAVDPVRGDCGGCWGIVGALLFAGVSMVATLRVRSVQPAPAYSSSVEFTRVGSLSSVAIIVPVVSVATFLVLAERTALLSAS